MSDPSVRIARCVAHDLPVVRELAQTIWRRHYPGIITDDQIEYMLARGYSDAALSEFLCMPDAGIVLARVADQPVGFAAWLRPEAPATIKLDKLYVLPGMHRRGIGRALMAHVEQAGRAAGCTRIVLNVNKRNAGAIATYERVGFVKHEEVVIDIGGGFVMDDYVMAKPLGSAS